MTNENKCDGNCYFKINKKNKSKCNYLSNNRCLINEYSDNYMFKERG